MHTKHKSFGKFQGNDSELLAKAVYNCSLDGSWGESLGESDSFGWYAYIPGKRYHFILCENSQGFVYVEHGTPDEMSAMWAKIEAEYEKWNEADELESELEEEES